MPTQLPNGTVIYNTTSHELVFWVGGKEQYVIAHPDTIINAAPETRDVLVNSRYTLVSVKFNAISSGWAEIERIKGERADALIVGSMIAAQTYPGDVVASVPFYKKAHVLPQFKKMVRSDRFTIFPRENNNGSR